MPKFYAQLNENDVCTGISQLNGEINSNKVVEIPFFDDSLFWKKYDQVTKSWSVEKFEPVSTAPLTEFEQLRADVDQLIISSLMGV